MTPEENKAVVSRYVDELWNQHDVTALDRYAQPQFHDTVLEHHRQLVDAFSDLGVEVHDIIAEGDTVALRLTVSGVHDRGPFAGRPPSGRRLAWGSFRFFRLEDGKVAETWAMQDRLGLMEQLGAGDGAGEQVDWADGAAR